MVGNSNSGGPRFKKRDDDRRGAKPGTTTMDGTSVGGNGGSIGQAEHVYSETLAIEIKALARILTLEQIGDELEISPGTIKKYYHKPFKAGRREVTKAVSSKLISQAMKGDKTAMIFYLKTQGGWNTKVEVGGLGGGPIRHEVFDFSAALEGKTEAELNVLIPFLEQLISQWPEDEQASGSGGTGAGA